VPVSTADRKYINQNLVTGILYKFRITAVNTNGSGPINDSVLLAGPYPNAPTSATIRRDMDNNQYVVTSALNEIAEAPNPGYAVMINSVNKVACSISLDKMNICYIRQQDIEDTNIALTADFTTSVFSVNAYGNSRSSTLASADGDISFYKEADKPVRPTVDSSQTTKDTIVLSWIEPITNGALISSYDIFAREKTARRLTLDNADADGWALIRTVTDPSASINGLDAGTTYEFKVTAKNAAGDSLSSDIMEAST